VDLIRQDQLFEGHVLRPQPLYQVHRTERCFKFLNEALGHPGEYGDKQIDDEMNAVKACVCRELKRIKALNRDILPEGQLTEWWNSYCIPEGGGALEGVVEITGSRDSKKKPVPA
jgi:hypothetical protein